MDARQAHDLLTKLRARRKEAAPVVASDAPSFEAAAANALSQKLKSQAWRDVRNIALATLGLGAAGRGAVGLFNYLRPKPPANPSLPMPLPLPYVEEDEGQQRRRKVAGFLAGDLATTVTGIPWYRPAAVLAGLGGLVGGWKGVDMVLDRQRRTERDAEMEKAKQDFHDALLRQYDRPLNAKSASAALGALLDQLFDQTLVSLCRTKAALDLGNLGGQAAGLYGSYAAMSGLLTGALVYDKMRKRSQREILQKALLRRAQRRMQTEPPEIYAVPEPVSAKSLTPPPAPV
jgi:hypothetical protein